METYQNLTTEKLINMTQKLSKTLLLSYIGNCILNVLLSLTATLENIVIAISLRKISTLHAPSRALNTSLCLSDLGVGVIARPLYVGYLIAEMNDQHQSKHGAVYAIHNVMSVFPAYNDSNHCRQTSRNSLKTQIQRNGHTPKGNNCSCLFIPFKCPCGILVFVE